MHDLMRNLLNKVVLHSMDLMFHTPSWMGNNTTTHAITDGDRDFNA